VLDGICQRVESHLTVCIPASREGVYHRVLSTPVSQLVGMQTVTGVSTRRLVPSSLYETYQVPIQGREEVLPRLATSTYPQVYHAGTTPRVGAYFGATSALLHPYQMGYRTITHAAT
jgi:hypothetical protein